jgi:hypothetical protein
MSCRNRYIASDGFMFERLLGYMIGTKIII